MLFKGKGNLQLIHRKLGEHCSMGMCDILIELLPFILELLCIL
jgi:hypothetical protein